MAIDVSGLNFFMPIFSFLLVFIIVYALLEKTKVLSGTKLVHFLISFIVAIVFISFSSIELFVREITPWFVIMIILIFFVLLIAGFSSGKLDKIMSPTLAWIFVGIFILIFLIVAIKFFNPIFHSSEGVIQGDGSESIFTQLKDFFSGRIGGGILLVAIAIIISWVVAKTK